MRRIARAQISSLFATWWLLLVLAYEIDTTKAFQGPIKTRCLYSAHPSSVVVLHGTPPEINVNENKEVPLGSKEYYDGFLAVTDEPRERVTGDAVLGPTLKFAGGISVGTMVLLLGFLASNGLL